MNPTAEQIQKINHFSKVNIDMCAKIASVVDIKECEPKEQLLTEGDRRYYGISFPGTGRGVKKHDGQNS